MRQLFWRLIAWIVTRPDITEGLLQRAFRTPFTHLFGRHDGSTLYMGRWWLFNPYPSGRPVGIRRWGDFLPSVRIHRICRPDDDVHLHDHPWNARTILLRGWYEEERPEDLFHQGDFLRIERNEHGGLISRREVFNRKVGYTGRLLFGQYHRITEVSPGGAWTLFITWRKRGTWGFMVLGEKVPHREYLKGET